MVTLVYFVLAFICSLFVARASNAGPAAHRCDLNSTVPFPFVYSLPANDGLVRSIAFQRARNLGEYFRLVPDRRSPLAKLFGSGTLFSSYPRSGNSWLRSLVEKASGFRTSSFHCDPKLAHKLLGECDSWRVNQFLIKTHFPSLYANHKNMLLSQFYQRQPSSTKSLSANMTEDVPVLPVYRKVLVVIRNPFDSIFSYAQYALASGDHVRKSDMQPGSLEWNYFLEYAALSYLIHYYYWKDPVNAESMVLSKWDGLQSMERERVKSDSALFTRAAKLARDERYRASEFPAWYGAKFRPHNPAIHLFISSTTARKQLREGQVLQMLKDHHSQVSLLKVRYEDLVANPFGSMERVLDFLLPLQQDLSLEKLAKEVDAQNKATIESDRRAATTPESLEHVHRIITSTAYRRERIKCALSDDRSGKERVYDTSKQEPFYSYDLFGPLTKRRFAWLFSDVLRDLGYAAEAESRLKRDGLSLA